MSETNRQVGRPKKQPSTVLKRKFTFLTTSKQFSLIDKFEDKGPSIREMLFSILPTMIDKFIEEDLTMDLSNNQWDIIEKIQKWGENDT